MKYWIQKKDNTPQGFPLKKLIQRVIQELGSSTFDIWILRSEGYGFKIGEWEELLNKQERLQVDYKSLTKISLGTEEWFYNVDIEIMTTNLQIRLGLHDSSMLYLEAPQIFSKRVLKSFKRVKKAHYMDK
jgi:hypothetical protein